MIKQKSLIFFGNDHNFDMSKTLKNPDMTWPREEFDENEGREWWHSDYKDVSFQHTYKFYDKIVELIEE